MIRVWKNIVFHYKSVLVSGESDYEQNIDPCYLHPSTNAIRFIVFPLSPLRSDVHACSKEGIPNQVFQHIQ